MKVLSAPADSSGKQRHIVLWGSGTVGAAMEQALRNRGCSLASTKSTQWNLPESVTNNARQSLTSKQLATTTRVDHIFAAGSAGFSSTQRHCGTELAAWHALLDGVHQQQSLCAHSANPRRVQLHLISSAGGLFEGKTNIGLSTEPKPLRAYGQLKLTQEKALVDRLGQACSHIYRLSSVYGAPDPNRRGSLIANLILNSFAHRVTPVTGNLDTLRDYIHADDVALFIADRVLGATAADGKPLTLASGRSSSILEVLSVIEQTTRRRPLIAVTDAHNAASVAFLPSVVAHGFEPADMRTRIATLVRNYTG